MEPLQNDPPKPKPKQSRFKPVVRQRIITKTAIKSEVKEEPDTAKGMEMLELFNEKMKMKKNIKFETKVETTNSRSSYERYKATSYLHTRKVHMKEYEEPWDYSGHYPVTLPLRRPYSGDPVLLDREEFGASTGSAEFDEKSNAAADLELMVEQEEPTFLFLQLPAIFPLKREIVNSEAREDDEGSKPQRPLRFKQNLCGLNDLPAGHMGKMLVYKSGAVKLKLGDTLYDVSSGLHCVFAQDLVAINTKDRHFCVVGELSKRVVVTPDIESIMDMPPDDTR